MFVSVLFFFSLFFNKPVGLLTLQHSNYKIFVTVGLNRV